MLEWPSKRRRATLLSYGGRADTGIKRTNITPYERRRPWTQLDSHFLTSTPQLSILTNLVYHCIFSPRSQRQPWPFHAKMPPKQKEYTRQQLTRGLAFQDQTPNFLKAFQARVSGRGGGADDDDAPAIANDDEYPDMDQSDSRYEGGDGGGVKLDEFGREIRMGSEEREMRAKVQEKKRWEKRMEEGDEEGDEAPLVVVLKEGKHLSAREAENERRKARGLPPLPDDEDLSAANSSVPKGDVETQKLAKTEPKSSVQLGGRPSGAKRKAPVGGREDEHDVQASRGNDQGPAKKKTKKEEKVKKKPVKGLLSFGDEA